MVVDGGCWLGFSNGGWWIGFSDGGGGGGLDFLIEVVVAWLEDWVFWSGGSGLGGGLDFLMVASGIAVGCFCLGEDRTERERERGRRLRIKKN